MSVAGQARSSAHPAAAGPVAAHIALAIVAPAVLVIGIFAAPFIRDPSTLPLGFDTSGYAWRTAVTQTEGLEALASDAKGLADRPGHPLVTALLGSIARHDTLTGAWIAPGVMAAAIALAAGAVGVDGLAGRRRYAMVAATGLGASAYVAWTALGFAANLMFDVVAVAAVLVAIRAMLGGRGAVVSLATLLAGGAAIHWMFAAVLATLLVVAIATMHVSARNARDSRHTRTALAAIGAGCLGAAGALLLAPELPDHLPRIDAAHVVRFTSARLASFGLPVVVPLAAAAVVVGVRTLVRRPGVAVLTAWASLAGLSLIAWSLLGLPAPPYRWTGFALGLPLLAAMAGPWLAELLVRPTPWAGVLAVALTLSPATWLAIEGAQVWWSQSPLLRQDAFEELGTVSSYLEREVPAGTPIAVSVRPDQGFDPLSRIRVGLAPGRVLDAAILRIDYELERPLAGAPPGAVVLHLSAFRPGPLPEGTLLGPGVQLLQGPSPTAPVEPGEPRSAPQAVRFIGLSLAWLITLALAGAGYSAILDISTVGKAAVSPAFGIAALAIAGEIAGRGGVRPGGWGAAVILGATALAGWLLAAVILGKDRTAEVGGWYATMGRHARPGRS